MLSVSNLGFFLVIADKFYSLSNCGSKYFEDLTTENTELHRDKKEEGFIPLHVVQRDIAS